MPEPERQTRSRLVELFAQHQLHPRHDLGQNFLIDLNLLEFVVAEAQLNQDDVVLEVGTGTGGMTAFLAEQAGAVVSVEIDPKVHAFAQDKLAGFPNATLLLTDILETKNELAPLVLRTVRERLAERPGRRLKLIANLPYSVATPVITNLLASDLEIERMVVTVQYEMGERMRGAPDTNDYGSLAVWIQSQCDCRILKRLGPAAFWPRPKVDSAIVRIVPDPERRAQLGDRRFFQEFLRGLFQQRRKVVRKVLAHQWEDRISPETLAEVLTDVGLTGSERAEQLPVDTLIRLSRRLAAEVEPDRGADGPPVAIPPLTTSSLPRA
jgi:16S rRNA (adenine1518-N6/adenine1519-N6)-dimethyltransferase